MVFDYLEIDHKARELNPMTNEHKKPWYRKINPNCAFPAIKDSDGFCTNEGVTITKYISTVVHSFLSVVSKNPFLVSNPILNPFII
jgi:glutathione S-transferase